MTNEITDYPVSRTLEEAYGDGEARAQMRRIEAEHDAKSPFQREVEKLGQRECRHCGWLCVPNDAPAKTFYPLEPQAAKQQAEPGADERAAFEAWMKTSGGYPYAGQFANLMWEAWQARAAQSGQLAGVAEGVREVIPLSDFSVELRFHSCRQAQAFIRAAAPTQQQEEK